MSKEKSITVFTLETKEDEIVENVINKFRERSNEGQIKYSTTLKDNKLPLLEWIEHAQQEAMDFVLYLETIKDEFNNN